MTIHTCPKCSAYYVDESLVFCLVDGMPLIGVDPGSDSWSEGTVVIEEKTSASKKQRRRLKWRRIVLGAMTTLIVSMVAARSFTVETTPAAGTMPALTTVSSPSSPVLSSLISPSESSSPTKTEASSPTKAEVSSPTKTEASSPARTEVSSPTKTEASSPTKTEASSPTKTEVSSPTKTETSSPTKTETSPPTPVYKISGRVIYSGQPLSGVKITLEGSKITSTTSDANGNYTFGDLRAGGSYTITPRAKVDLTPLSRDFNNLTQDESANFSGVGKNISLPGVGKDNSSPGAGKDDFPLPQGCSAADQSFEDRTIRDSLGARWRKKIEGERARIIAENVPPGMAGEPSLSPFEYQSAFPRGCNMAVVRLTYAWLIRTGSPVAPAKTLRVPKRKLFECYKVFGLWTCRY